MTTTSSMTPLHTRCLDPMPAPGAPPPPPFLPGLPFPGDRVPYTRRLHLVKPGFDIGPLHEAGMDAIRRSQRLEASSALMIPQLHST